MKKLYVLFAVATLFSGQSTAFSQDPATAPDAEAAFRQRAEKFFQMAEKRFESVEKRLTALEKKGVLIYDDHELEAYGEWWGYKLAAVKLPERDFTDVFERQDVDEDGFLSEEEGEGYGNKFAAHDKDQDGRLSFDEFGDLKRMNAIYVRIYCRTEKRYRWHLIYYNPLQSKWKVMISNGAGFNPIVDDLKKCSTTTRTTTNRTYTYQRTYSAPQRRTVEPWGGNNQPRFQTFHSRYGR